MARNRAVFAHILGGDALERLCGARCSPGRTGLLFVSVITREYKGKIAVSGPMFEDCCLPFPRILRFPERNSLVRRTGNFHSSSSDQIAPVGAITYDCAEMPKPDFSHLRRITAEMVARQVRRGGPVTDEMLLEATCNVTPALLPSSLLQLLRRELDPQAERRGRRAKAVAIRADLIDTLRAIQRDDVPAEFVSALIKRLETNRRFTDLQHAIAADRVYEKRKRDNMICGLYSDFTSCSLTPPIVSIIP